MMREIIVIIILLFVHPLIIQGVEEVFPFVVLDGKVYRVLEEQVEGNEIGREIGEVTTLPDAGGQYYGNASNKYPVGTKYYQVKQTDIFDAISVFDGEQYLKAVFTKNVPFHWKNLFIHSIPYLFLLSLVVIYVVREEYKKQVLEDF
ncbi:hypothetical protein [Gracilibacillus xinjiangensis]|uniref:DUF3592 domain-containing protein n=1 Tax=Gracilibacillus xinjiangensis TaxID=1193282 RepID=A0ABV8WTM2_9BACI